MKVVVGVIMGFFSASLLDAIFGVLVILVDPHTPIPSSAAVISLALWWTVSTWLILHGSMTISKVVSRGFLFQAAEWLFLGFACLVVAGRLGSHYRLQAIAALTGGALAGFSTAMAVVCLIGFTISHLLGREMRQELPEPGRKCPECAELIQAEAKRCRFCGSELDTQSPEPADSEVETSQPS